ncbi:hypothetical protein E2C01_045930 [Portunus trituberculatus]|uniref:Uncharacterized protein n=1 Tax=Portunus trituberculatus TaxID=210409 RepID=A0A5B7FWF6_PORTR|nr:hypothetical protein [Portunus trituberculatus]
MRFHIEVEHPYNGVLKLKQITDENRQTKVIIKNYPSYLPLSYIADHSNVLRPERKAYRGTQDPQN